MTPEPLILAAAAGAVSLAICATLWALAQRRRLEAGMAALTTRIARLQDDALAAHASAEAFDSALLAVEDGAARLASGEDSLAACAAVLGLEADSEAQAVVNALMKGEPDHARRLRALFERGEPCAFEARGPAGTVSVEGRTAGALAWLRLAALAGGGEALPTAARFAALLDARPEPAWIAGADGRPEWGNRAWLAATQSQNAAEAAAAGHTLDSAADALAAEAANLNTAREVVRWTSIDGRRRALRFVAEPLEGGGAGVWSFDVTPAEEMKEILKRQIEAHDETLNHIAEAVAIFGQNKKLMFHNAAFAELWGLEPAWLADTPTHGEVLDRLRQRRRLPETADYARWRANELARYDTAGALDDEVWTLPDSRTLRVVRQPHPLGGIVFLFSDITGELKLKAQYNGQIQVQQATLDKLNDAVAVFGSDGRLRLHNEAFARFWNVTPHQLDEAGGFEGVVELCLPRLHDPVFWREMKGRVADPDPESRQPVFGEARTSDARIVEYQTRPLPDGATLIAFADVTDTRRLEGALAASQGALDEAERLKRDFVGNVSYELRTPLTTIIGYSELLQSQGESLSERGKGYAAAVRGAATQLARSIEDVLDIAQIDANEMVLDSDEIRLCELLNDTAQRWASSADAGKLEIVVACDDQVGLMRGDTRRLAQVLDHLVDNAVRQTPAGGRITLSAARSSGELRLQVTDTGRGIPFHVQPYLFDRFVGRDRGGAGLGLALVKALVELHGGWVEVQSEPGHGAVFTCHLPEIAQTQGVAQAELGF
jgi:signal transduction histidine kinase